MKCKLNILCFLFSLIVATACGDKESGDGGSFTVQTYKPVAVSKTNSMKVYAHYMPWFETPQTTTNGSWGYHWTMNKVDPNQTDANGRRKIAAHYYPLIGPYASSDADVLEYHLLLMKYAGIDGILIDWYGTRNLYDYPENKRNTEAVVEMLGKVGLDFAIVYEDQTLNNELEEHLCVPQAKADMKYLETNFFNRTNYIKVNGRPLIMCFGPQALTEPADWTAAFSVLKDKPVFLPLQYFSHRVNNAANTNGQGEFMWTGNDADMANKYEHLKQFELRMGGALPGFKDYYVEGGQYPTYEHENGARLERDLALATQHRPDFLQLITWNDFGEGTMIEPTVEFGYKFLTSIQRFAGVNYGESHLADVLTFYKLRQNAGKDELTRKKLLQIHYYMVSLQPEKAAELMKELNN